MNSLIHIFLLGSIVGMAHFVVVGILYGNPIINRIYADAQGREPGVRRWPSRGHYLLTQFLGTQVEVFILAVAYAWLRPHLGVEGFTGTLLLGLVFAAIRVYPRFWNMWIQSTYPARLLKVELVNGVLSTLTIVAGLEWVCHRLA
jgi:hypothetical protein